MKSSLSSVIRLAPRFLSTDRIFSINTPLPQYVNEPNKIEFPPNYIPKYLQKEEIRSARDICNHVSNLLHLISSIIKPGVSSQQIDDYVFRYCQQNDYKLYPSPFNYHGFPASVCVSRNSVACHGVPSVTDILMPGDIVSVDVSLYNGLMHGDSCCSFLVTENGHQSLEDAHLYPRQTQLLRVVQQCLHDAVSVCGPEVPFSAIPTAIESCLNRHPGYEVIPQICGHGVGRWFHSLPDVYHVPVELEDGEEDPVMSAGMMFTIEPCICDGCPEVAVSEQDHWSVYTLDNSYCAQYEHTLLITDGGCQVLTKNDLHHNLIQ